MADLGDLVGQPITGSTSFNWTWFIELVTCSCLALFFLFYFNRLFATLVSYGLRAFTWHKYRIWIDIQSLQLSFLAGRIFFKGLRYHAENETVLIQSGYITWRYWLRSARQVDLSMTDDQSHVSFKEKTSNPGDASQPSATVEDDQELGPIGKPDASDARLAITVSGLEWFVYNRTPVYASFFKDDPLAKSKTEDTNPEKNGMLPKSFSGKLRHRLGTARPDSKDTFASESSTDRLSNEKSDQSLGPDEARVPISRMETYTSAASREDEPTTNVSTFYSLMVRTLPISIECTKGAITLGNENTRAIMVTTFASAFGHIDAATSGPLDIFRQVFDFEIDHPKVEMKPNPDYRRSQTAAAEKYISAAESLLRKKRRWWKIDFGIGDRVRRIGHGLKRLLPGLRSSRGSLRTSASPDRVSKGHFIFEDFHDQNRSWHGLTRYLDEDERDDHESWSHVDYARFSQVLDSPAVHLNFYWDIPGEVVEEQEGGQEPDANCDEVNGCSPPGYGLDLTVRGGFVNYGPWADRLRLEIQNVFFPNPFKSVTPAEALGVGQPRQSTVMTIRVDLEDEVSLRVPTKERSKDWQWRGRAHTVRDAAAVRKQRGKRHFRFRRSQKTKIGPDIRPFGWLTVSAGKDSTVRYDMDMFPRSQGYQNLLRLDLKNTKATSSVNHALLWRCRSQMVFCDLSNPLAWNSPHSWIFDVENNAMEMFLLRDHMFLLTDLISDFTAGQKPDYMTFVPFLYKLHLTFPNLKLYLNANDYNIIDNPCDLEENAFLILGFQQLTGNVDIPMQYFAPRQSSVKFLAEGHNAYLELVTPLWSTLNTLVEEKTTATLKQLSLEGSYNYYTNVAPTLTDSLFMTVTGYAPQFYLHGYLIRYFMNVKENYFGEDLHFRTLEEYQNMLADPENYAPRPGLKKENDLDVILTVRADNSSVLLPANIYSRTECVRVDVLAVEADMRFTNYYMDLQVNSSPLEASIQSTPSSNSKDGTSISNCQLFIDSAGVYGHRLFGAPPTEPTYVCNWDIDVGEITGECSSKFIQTLIPAIMSFVFTLDDDENALPEIKKSIIHDVTFLRVNLAALRLWLVTTGAAFLFELSESDLSFGDWAGSSFAKTLRAHVPRILFAVVDHTSAIRHHDGHSGRVKTHASFETSLTVGSLDKSEDLAHTRALQQQHIRYHDQRTHRADWLLKANPLYPANHKTPDWARERPAMPVPVLPEPVGQVRNTNLLGGTGNKQTPKERIRKSSFLSSSSVSLHRSGASKPHASDRRLLPPALKGGYQGGTSKNPLPPSENLIAQGKTTSNLADMNDLHAHTNLVTFSSPWTPPHFTLHNVQPDTTNMPPASSLVAQEWSNLVLHTSMSETQHGEFEHTPHNGLVCLVGNGLSGFCTPDMFLSIGELIRELRTDRPVDWLDQVQIDLMKQVMEMYKHRDHGHLVDIAIHLPRAHIKLINSIVASEKFPGSNDQYNIKLVESQVMYRSLHRKTNAQEQKAQEQSQVVYGSIQSLSISARDDALQPGKAGAQAELSLANTGFWLYMKEETKSKLQLSNFDIVLWSDRLANMAGLIQRSAVMVDYIAGAFSGLDESSKSKHLIYHLTQAGSSVSDPVYLTKPSYVLRSADKHVRLTDSWKIMTRLRYIFFTLLSENDSLALGVCDCKALELESSARKDVLSSFERWRGWDYARDRVPLMNKLFEDLGPGSPRLVERPPALSTEIVVGKLGFILDPGPRQSDLAMLGLDLNLALGPVDGSLNDQPTQKVIVQAYLADIALHLNWALLELARQVIELGNPFAAAKPTVAIKRTAQVDQSVTRRQFTIVLGSDAASIYLTTLNLRLKWGAESFRSAVSFNTGGIRPEVASFTIAANTAMARFKSHSRSLLMWELRSPKLYGSVSYQALSTEKTIVRVGAASNKLRFEMKENIVGLLSVVESVIYDEVHIIMRLRDQMPLGEDESHAAGHIRNNSPLDLDLHIAMFLDDYRLKISIVPTLSYTIAGNVARTSVLPRKDGGLDINFDIKQHEHLFEVPRGTARNNLSILKMPPISGRLSVRQTPQFVVVHARTTVEQVNLEAAGVRACFDALNQPGVVQLVPDTKRLVQRIRSSLDQVKGRPAESHPTQPVKPMLMLRFAIHGTLAGVNIHMSAPSVHQGSNYKAEMELRLEGTTLFIHNESDDLNSIYEHPQFSLDSKGVGLSVYRTAGHNKVNVGKVVVGLKASGRTSNDSGSRTFQVYRAKSEGITVELYEETASVGVDIAQFIQDRVQSIKLADASDNITRLRRMTAAGISDRLKPKDQVEAALVATMSQESTSSALYDSTYALDLEKICIRWNLTRHSVLSPTREPEDLVFSIRRVDLQTRQEGTARLSILDTQLQIVPQSQADSPTQRTANSALLPEVVFGAVYLSTKRDRRFAFQAKGKALDLRLATDSVIGAHALQKSIANASADLREAKKSATENPQTSGTEHSGFLGGNRLASLLVDADFAGAVVHISPRAEVQQNTSVFGFLKGKKRSRAGRYGQAVQGDDATSAILKSPGVALKIEYSDNGQDDPSLSTEVKVAASSNTLYPTVVPLIHEISSSVKEILGDEDSTAEQPPPQVPRTSYLSDATITNTTPKAILGRCKLNAGLYIQRQEFSLSCQPIARVAATTRFADIFVAVNTVSAPDQERFFAVLTTFNKLEASVQHVYSRESTASFEVDSVVMSLMNSKHVSSRTGISVILNISPMNIDINAKQVQDFLLFREIWYPAELRRASKPTTSIATTQDQQAYAMQRYQEISAQGTLPWHAIISIQEIKLQVDLGQGLGKSVLTISKLWASSKKNNDSEQNLCIGFDRVGIDSTGRMSGFVELQNMKARTSIRWPIDSEAHRRAPLVQASIAFEHLRVKASFDYQPFAVADISSFEFLMYNVRQGRGSATDRLVGILDGGKVQIFCTTATAGQALALVQAFERLVQEKQEAYQTSLRDLDKFLRRKSVFPSSSWVTPPSQLKEKSTSKGTFSLHTDVVVTLKALDLGAFPTTFFDTQILKVEATDVQARFAVATTEGKTHSGLGMSLGQVRVALSNVNRVTTKALSEVSVPEVIEQATTSRGGTIVKVPRLVSSMQTWQEPDSNIIEHVFRSTFEGKVDVGWNFARINFIRGMWQTHSRGVAQRLGKPLAPSAVKITAEPQGEGENGGQEKITAVVNVPQSRFTYVALVPPMIDTPQLRDMGEATPPLEWIGLHRDKLPEATHSIAIVSLLEIAREVEDAYARILGAS
ncbi:uncharacterized protein A1O9_05722 [Exophiala aquamarina CBS 119918]|uniref:Elongation factor 2 n=1 Tax=Exophiala aquamarina CBS 119918 TaxID=1182545 RepID=A0A072PDI7_9EURO|nr:uncharacterized protein A1O9_05722 [Exophiala aquamarina CBS 119918]KEF57802.1 hypothetical protein A1O9_05722 [Exophiala aquamarina CBS 119918]